MNRPSQPTIRLATPGDASCLAQWNAVMAEETEGKALDRRTLEQGVRGVFDDPGRGFYLIAELDGERAGGLLVTYEWSDWRNGSFWWIQSVYVATTARRRGVFRALHAEVERRARIAGAIGLRLYVEVENARAQRTYENLDMQRCRYYMYENEFD